MSGGIFPNYPFTLNIKCIIFALLIMIIYTYRPPTDQKLITKLIIYFIIFVVSYVALAWYDYYYACSQLPLQRSSIGITQYLKPPVYEEEKQELHMMSQKEIDKNNKTIYYMHLLLFVPLLLYIAIKRENAHKSSFDILLVVIAFTAVYHGFRALAVSH